MPQYQIFVRLHELDPWCWADTYDSAMVAWAGLLIARARGMQVKIMQTRHVVERVVALA